jgi:hypothetical protein
MTLIVESGSKSVNQYFQVLQNFPTASPVNTGNGQKTPFSLFTNTLTGSSGFLYMNGNQVNSATISGTFTNSTDHILGARMVSSSISNYLNGLIAEVVLYNSATTSSASKYQKAFFPGNGTSRASFPARNPWALFHSSTFLLDPRRCRRQIHPSNTDAITCQTWLDSADTSTFTFSSGSNVSQWSDEIWK